MIKLVIFFRLTTLNGGEGGPARPLSSTPSVLVPRPKPKAAQPQEGANTDEETERELLLPPLPPPLPPPLLLLVLLLPLPMIGEPVGPTMEGGGAKPRQGL